MFVEGVFHGFDDDVGVYVSHEAAELLDGCVGRGPVHPVQIKRHNFPQVLVDCCGQLRAPDGRRGLHGFRRRRVLGLLRGLWRLLWRLRGRGRCRVPVFLPARLGGFLGRLFGPVLYFPGD